MGSTGFPARVDRLESLSHPIRFSYFMALDEFLEVPLNPLSAGISNLRDICLVSFIAHIAQQMKILFSSPDCIFPDTERTHHSPGSPQPENLRLSSIITISHRFFASSV